MARRDTLPLSTVLAALAALVAATLLVGQLAPAWFVSEQAQLRAERGWAATPAETAQTKASQAARLGGYAWIDRQKGVVALPIERAMELEQAELARAQQGGAR